MSHTEVLEVLIRAVNDQPLWHTNRQNGYAYRFHGRHIAVIAIAAPETTVDWSFSVRDVINGTVTIHGDRTGPVWSLLEELNVALSEAERKHRERLRDDRI